jgi:hypothetical protein
MKAFRNYLIGSSLVLTILSLYVSIHYQVPYPQEIGPQLDNHIRSTYTDLLNEQQPDLLLLGDSMLGAGVDGETVAHQLGKKDLLLSLPGTASTIWYLMIKNNIVVAEHKPKYLIVFFRDSMMTVPGYRVTGRYFEQIDELAARDDKLLIQRAYLDQMSLPEKMADAYLPLYGSRWRIRQDIDHYIRYSLGRALLGCNSTCMDHAMEVIFNTAKLDLPFLSDAIAASDEYMYTPERLRFGTQVGKSFLPEIIRLCRENDIQLILVRMPVLSFAQPRTEPAGLEAYIQDLTRYLAENRVPFLNFEGRDFPGEYFSDALHLNEQGKAAFTRKLVEALRTLIQ